MAEQAEQVYNSHDKRLALSPSALLPAAGFPACTHAPRVGCPQVSAGCAAASLAGATGSSITPSRGSFAGLESCNALLLVTVCTNTYTLHLQEICRFLVDSMSNITKLSGQQVEACLTGPVTRNL